MVTNEDDKNKEWMLLARAAMFPIMAELRRVLKRRFPALPEEEIGEILCNELADAVCVILSRKDTLTLDQCRDALGRVEQRCVDRASKTRPEQLPS